MGTDGTRRTGTVWPRKVGSTRRGARRLIGLAAVAALLVGPLAACSESGPGSASGGSGGSKLGKTETFKLGVSLALNNTDFWTSYIGYQKQYAKQYHAKLIGPLVNNNDSGKQISDIRTLISEGAQALIVNPVDSAAIKPALDYAKSKGIPVVSVDVAPTAGDTYMIVRADNELYGTESCEYIGKHATSGTVAELQGDLSSLNGRDRSTAFEKCMASKFPKLKVAKYPTKWDASTATTAAATAMSSHKDLVGIYTQWSGPVPGIIQAEKSAGKYKPVGKPGHIIMVSNDGVPFEMKDIRDGVLDATVSQPATLYAKYAVSYSRDALMGKKYAKGQQAASGAGPLVTVGSNLEDPIKAPLVTSQNVDDPSLWGNQAATK
ncbi:sugar ABC transporter substrate-binding protein [Actinocatenispora sera]|uniref:sugar ABC transporter substrate-binding protein n=1 Tax=Actinocatenispora sera TaxID=390989 RepID=UPI0034119F35